MKVEKKFIKNSMKEKIATVIHHPQEPSKGSVLLQHGFFSNKNGEWKRRADLFAEEGFKAVRFDRRGYGESDRDFHEFNLTTGIEDSLTILNFLEQRGEKNFTIYGSSFGGLIAIHATSLDSRINALGLRAPVTFTEKLFTELRKKTKKNKKIDLEEMPNAQIKESFFQDLKTYDAKTAAEKIKVPTIIFHGTNDEIVPLENSKHFYELLKTKKEFNQVEREGHVFNLDKDKSVLRKSAEWFTTHC